MRGSRLSDRGRGKPACAASLWPAPGQRGRGRPARESRRTTAIAPIGVGTALDGVASRPHVQDRTSSSCLPLLEARTAKASGVMVPCPPARPSPRRGLWALMEGDRTARKRHEPEEMVAKLRLVAAGAPVPAHQIRRRKHQTPARCLSELRRTADFLSGRSAEMRLWWIDDQWTAFAAASPGAQK